MGWTLGRLAAGQESAIWCLLGTAAVLVLAGAVRAETVETTATFKSGGKDVRVERFEPKAKGKHPAVLILNGSTGVEAHAKDYRDFARGLAEKGYVALLVHYFDRTGTRNADKNAIDAHYLAWVNAVYDAVAYAGGLENVDKQRVGLLGFSLGAYVSLSVAATKGKPHVAAVAEYFGGLADLPFNNIKNMPPVLILHGEKDDVVSPEAARKLEALLKKHGVPHEIKLYANQKHIFIGDDAKDAAERVVQFFDKHLKAPPSPSPKGP